MEVDILWNGELGKVYRTGPQNSFHYGSLTPISHNRVLGLMAQQHASEISPIPWGNLMCNGIRQARCHQRWQLHRHQQRKSDKHHNKSRVANPKGTIT